jgi:hypothetical protein
MSKLRLATTRWVIFLSRPELLLTDLSQGRIPALTDMATTRPGDHSLYDKPVLSETALSQLGRDREEEHDKAGVARPLDGPQ